MYSFICALSVYLVKLYHYSDNYNDLMELEKVQLILGKYMIQLIKATEPSITEISQRHLTNQYILHWLSIYAVNCPEVKRASAVLFSLPPCKMRGTFWPDFYVLRSYEHCDNNTSLKENSTRIFFTLFCLTVLIVKLIIYLFIYLVLCWNFLN